MAQDLATEFVAELYRRERTGIARSVARIAGESHAEDLVHDAFVAYLTKTPWATRPGAWVSTVARNRALNELRRPKLVPLAGTEEAGDADAPDAEREAVRATVASALELLDERSLHALRLKFFEGASYERIAGELEVRVPQAHVIVHRALRRLGRALIRRMADVHGAKDCAPALARMAGLGGSLGGAEDHADGPCPLCRPAWDEIVALRIGAWIPAPLLAFKGRLRGWMDRLAGRASFRGALAAEGASRAATAFVALGVAAGTFAPSAAVPLSTPQQATVPVVRPAAGSTVSDTVADTAVTAPQTSDAPAERPEGGVDARIGNPAPGTHVAPPDEEDPGHVSNDTLGGVLVCTDISKPCTPGDGEG